MNLLFVDDESFCEGTYKSLEKEGFKVFAAFEGIKP